MISEASSIDMTISRRTEFIELLAYSGMELSMWAANDTRLTADLPSSENDVRVQLESDISVLGLLWRPSADSFYFSLNQTTDSQMRLNAPTLSYCMRALLMERPATLRKV